MLTGDLQDQEDAVGHVVRRGNGWQAAWRDPVGRERTKTFGRKIDAERHVVAMEHSKLAGSYVDPAAGRITFAQYVELWTEVQVHRTSTAENVQHHLRHILPRIGHRPIGALRPSDIQGLVRAMQTGDELLGRLAPSTIKVGYSWLTTIFASAVADRVISETPCRRIALPEVEHRKIEPLPVETVEALAAAFPDRYRAIITLGAGTGVRIGEALGLTADRIDWSRRNVLIDRQLLTTATGLPLWGPVKDKRNRPRTIPLPDVVLDALSDHIDRVGLGTEGLVFSRPNGKALRRAAFSSVWREVAEPLGIPSGDGFHQLRHFYASVLIRAGESVKVVQDRLGHASARITLDIYSHLWPDQEDHTRAAVDAVLRIGHPDSPRTSRGHDRAS